MFKKKKGKVNSTESFINYAKEIHGEKYLYNKTNFIKMSNKLIVTCPVHGDILMTPGNHLYNKQGCKQCYIESKYSNLEEFINGAKAIHGDKYDYSKSVYKGVHTKLTVICPKHGEFSINPHHHKLGIGCSQCGKLKTIEAKRYDQATFIEKSRKKHKDFYDYSKTVYIKSNVSVIITCPIHGDFEQTPNSHLNGQGCRKCGYINLSNLFKHTLEEFVLRAKSQHGDKYNYDKVNYINAKTKVIITCPIHGDFEQTPNAHLSGNGCCSCSSSKGELFIEKILKENNVLFIREYILPEINNTQHRYDFWLPNHNLLIEFHGGQHYFPVPYFGGEKGFKYTKERDLYKKWMAKETKRNLVIFNYKQFRNLNNFKRSVLKILNKYSFINKF